MKKKLLLSVVIAILVPAAHAAINEKPASDVIYGPAPNYQYDPLIASDGTNFLIVWLDERSFPSAMYAARMTRQGELLDPTGIRIPVSTLPAALLFAGDAYVVLFTKEQSLYATRISREGEILENGKLLESNQTSPPIRS